jgi:hypothetical protein
VTGVTTSDVDQSRVATWSNKVMPRGTLHMANDDWCKSLATIKFDPVTFWGIQRLRIKE